MVAYGETCEGDGPCGTSNLIDNCGYRTRYGTVAPLDFYVREACDLGAPPAIPPQPAPPPLPPKSPQPGGQSGPGSTLVSLVVLGGLGWTAYKVVQCFMASRKAQTSACYGIPATEPDETELHGLTRGFTHGESNPPLL